MSAIGVFNVLRQGTSYHQDQKYINHQNQKEQANYNYFTSPHSYIDVLGEIGESLRNASFADMKVSENYYVTPQNELKVHQSLNNLDLNAFSRQVNSHEEHFVRTHPIQYKNLNSLEQLARLQVLYQARQNMKEHTVNAIRDENTPPVFMMIQSTNQVHNTKLNLSKFFPSNEGFGIITSKPIKNILKLKPFLDRYFDQSC